MDAQLPVAVGFGITNAEHVAQVAEFADAAVIGSAIVELIERTTPHRDQTGARRSGPIYQGSAPAARGAGPVKETASAFSLQLLSLSCADEPQRLASAGQAEAES